MKVDFKSIDEAISGPKSNFFWVSIAPRSTECGNKESYYAKRICDENLTFDVSNNKVLVNVNLNGTIKFFTTYRQSYPADNSLPGVWWHKDFTKTGPYFYSVQIENELFDLTKVNWPLKTSLLGNIFPLTQLRNDKIEIDLIVYAPISLDGSCRPPAAFYGFRLVNISKSSMKGQVMLPHSGLNTFVTVADGGLYDRVVPFNLAPGQGMWIPTVIAAVPGEETMSEINKFSSLEWLNQTLSYFKGITGDLKMPKDPFTAEFFERAIHQCFHSIGMTREGEVAGSNWGSYPTTQEIWMKDMYYSFLPFFAHEPELFKKGILWFLRRSVRYKSDKIIKNIHVPQGRRMEGGVNHSLSNALTPAIMAGLYYSVTGDKEFFKVHPEVLTNLMSLLNEVLKSRKSDPYLFPSAWISDGPSRGDFHTGSNVVAWYSFKSVADIIEDVVGDVNLAKHFRIVADNIKRDLDQLNIIEGPLGPQYAEGTNLGRSVVFGHDGEESDTTLMPFYGYAKYDDQAYQNHVRVAMTDANPWYRPNTKGIEWEFLTDATFPGYITGLAGVRNHEEMSGPEGCMTIIRRLTDVDGSIWWWPYLRGDVDGAPIRAFPIGGSIIGKCGWASGVFVAHFVSQILGLRYDARTKTLKFRPFSPSSDFSWKDFRLGNAFFSVDFRRTEGCIQCSIENQNETGVKVEVELILDRGTEPKKIIINGEEYKGSVDSGRFFDLATLKVQQIVPQKQILVLNVHT